MIGSYNYEYEDAIEELTQHAEESLERAETAETQLAAAQARIAELEGELKNSARHHERWLEEGIATDDKLAAAEAAIARVYAVLGQRLVQESRRGSDHEGGRAALRDQILHALAPPSEPPVMVYDGTTPDPEAPLAIADLPDWWDARRVRLGKPDKSTCAAELEAALKGDA